MFWLTNTIITPGYKVEILIWTELSYGSMSKISGNVNHTELIDHAIQHLFPLEVTGATDKDVLTPDPQESMP